MTGRNTRTPEHRTAQRQVLLDMFGEAVATLTSSQEWVAYRRFMAAFRYSFNDMLLIAAQCPHATHVAG